MKYNECSKPELSTLSLFPSTAFAFQQYSLTELRTTVIWTYANILSSAQQTNTAAHLVHGRLLSSWVTLLLLSLLLQQRYSWVTLCTCWKIRTGGLSVPLLHWI